ncbi:MAG: hypothetical protein AB1726_00970, partial [Planctomycetota bacterium]
MRRTFLLSAALLASAPAVLGQAPVHPAASLDLDGSLEWLDGGAVFLDGPGGKSWFSDEEAALDRPAFLDGAVARAREEGKLVLWYVPRILEESSGGAQMYRAPVLDVYMRQVVFADEDVAGIVRHGFVPVRLAMDEALSKRTGLRPLAFVEPAVVFLDGDGKVIHFVERIRTFDALWFADLLRRVLERAGRPADETGDSLAAEIAAGRWEAALARLERKAAPDAGELLALAGLLRRLRRPAEAFARLEAAAAAGAGADQVDLERGRLLVLTGDLGAARAPLDRAFDGGHAEAGYLLALARLAGGDDAEAGRLFRA